MNEILREYWDKKLYQECVWADIFRQPSDEDIPPGPWYVRLWRTVRMWTIWHLHIVDIRDYHKLEDCDW